MFIYLHHQTKNKFKHLKTKIMKKIFLLLAISILSFSSCKKETIEPVQKNVLKYYVSCIFCNIQVKDEFNFENSFNNTGIFRYETTQTKADSTKVEIQTSSVIGLTQRIIVEIKLNNKVLAKKDTVMDSGSFILPAGLR